MALSDNEVNAFLDGHTDHLGDEEAVNSFLDGKTDNFALPSHKGSAMAKLMALAQKAAPLAKVLDIGQALTGNPIEALPALADNRQALVNQAPAVMGVAGGALGAPLGPAGSIGMAALGGAGGEAIKQVNNAVAGNPETSSVDAAKRIGIEGLKQGAYQAGGEAISGAAKGLETLFNYLKMGDKIGALARLPEGTLGAAYDNPAGMLPPALGGAPTEAGAKAAYSDAVAPLKASLQKLSLEDAVDSVGQGATKLPQSVIDTVNIIKDGKATEDLTVGQLYDAERRLKDAMDVAYNRSLRPGDDTVKVGRRVLRDQIAPAFQDAYTTVRDYLDSVAPKFADATRAYADQKQFGPLRNVLPVNTQGRPDFAGFALRGLATPGVAHLAQSPIVQGLIASGAGAAAIPAKIPAIANSSLQTIRDYLLNSRPGQ